jgi:Zn-dependent peptidase ImmA (M78 family)
MILGQPNKLQFEFTPGSHDHALGFGSLRVALGNSPIWSNEKDRGIPWTWIDLLEQLARAWPFIKYEESTPPEACDTLALLSTGHIASSEYFEPAPESTKETYVFLRRHNLATGIEGLYLPSLSLLREGRRIWVASPNITRLLELAETLDALSELGDALAAHIATGTPQSRANLALQSWQNREPSLESVLQIKLGSDRLAMEMVPPGQSIAEYFEAHDAQNDDEYESSLLVAARMSATLPLESRRRILDLLRARPATGVSPLLREISAEAAAVIPEYTRRPFEQGQKLAQWARRKFGLSPDAKADPQEILRRLGVEITNESFGIDVLDAVGCWGRHHGPAVLVNLDGTHAQSPRGRRATLAHELAHVLIDRSGSLPAAEVFGGTVPRHPEQRANAFAAEFLLPKTIVAERIPKAGDAQKAIEQLREHFGVSRELAAWQIINTAVAFNSLGNSEKALLKSWTANAEHVLLF